MIPILNWKKTSDGFLALKLKDSLQKISMVRIFSYLT